MVFVKEESEEHMSEPETWKIKQEEAVTCRIKIEESETYGIKQEEQEGHWLSCPSRSRVRWGTAIMARRWAPPPPRWSPRSPQPRTGHPITSNQAAEVQ
ncbi:hypothetical protein QQF64_034269 [Cirrhinus molitorella]|uniref:Uncharacterized protein n=1 Tax=Cirrhinus molitorella TaxID=172907 RepID=A0ABR3L524_9TELE